jgi:hypothetical protein
MKIENGEQAVTRHERSMIEVAQTRASQEVQGAMVIAKRFPRDETAAIARILQACKRKSLAEQSQYAYPRGGTKVEGPSIRLAEVLAQNWGNIESGVIELERKERESVAMAYCWDLESNARDVKVFTVPHVRDRSEAKGGSVELSDMRDIYELVANMGARRKRACILAIIPGDVVDHALEQCDKTLEGDTKEPLIDRIRKMASAFADLTVTIPLLERRLGHVLDATTEAELTGLRKIFASLRDGMSKREDWFQMQPGEGLAEGKQPFGFKAKAEATKPPVAPEAAAAPEAAQTSPAPSAVASSPESPASPAGPSAPSHLGEQETLSSLMKDIQGLAKAKGIKLQDLNVFAEKRYGKALVHCRVVDLQGLKGKLDQHPKGDKFE